MTLYSMVSKVRLGFGIGSSLKFSLFAGLSIGNHTHYAHEGVRVIVALTSVISVMKRSLNLYWLPHTGYIRRFNRVFSKSFLGFFLP